MTILTIWRPILMETDIWTVAQAKAKLSELIEHARNAADFQTSVKSVFNPWT